MKRLVAAAAIVVGAGVAHADPEVERALAMRAAQQLFSAGDLAGCGAAFLAIYRKTPKAGDADEQLFNAGVCFERGRLATDAAAAYATLRREFPRSQVAARSLPRYARLELDTGEWETAATLFEDYARRFAGEKDAPDAADNALQIRIAFGPPAKAIEDAAYIEKTWPPRGADAAYRLATTLADAHALERQRAYLKTYGARPRQERVAQLHLAIAERLLATSCPGGETAGLCTKPAPPTCGAPFTAAPRDAAKLREARAELDHAIHESDRWADRGAARDLYARAHLHVLDLDVEAARDPAKIAAAVAAIEGVLGVTDAPATVAAMARAGELDRALATCKQVPDAAALATRAADTFAACEQLAADLSVDDAAAARCHAGLLALAPDRTTAELLPPIAFSLDPIDAAPLADPANTPDHAGFGAAEIAGWTPSNCKAMRARFAQGSAAATYMQGLVAARCNDPAAALVKFELAAKTDPHLAQAQIGRGRAAWLLGKRDVAVAAWQAALAIDPHASAAALDLAMVHRDRPAVLATLALAPGDPAALGALAALDPPHADFYIGAVDPDSPLHAVLAAQHGGLFAPHTVVTAEDARIAGLVELRRRHWQAAADLLPRAAPTYDVLVGLGVAYHHLKRDTDARSLYDRAIALDAARPEAPADRALLP